MLAVNYTNLRENMKNYMDKVTDDYETMIVTRKNNRNVVMMSEEAYNNLMENLHVIEDRANYDWLMDGEGEMFSDLPQTVLDELCSQYELDDLDRFIVELYVGLPKDVRDGIKARAKDLIQKREVSEGGKNIE